MSIAPLVDAYLDQLREAGIVVRRQTVEAMISERVVRLAEGTGLDGEQALAFYDADVARSWAREAAAQYRDEQPDNLLLRSVPTELAPITLIAACIAELIDADPAAARSAARILSAYPAILLGGVAMCRFPTMELRRLAEALAQRSPALSGRCAALVEAAQRRHVSAGGLGLRAPAPLPERRA